jgi:hypothetical protein
MNHQIKHNANKAKANVIAGMAQDIIDDISCLVIEHLENFEKEVLDILNDSDSNWTTSEKPKKGVDKKKKK